MKSFGEKVAMLGACGRIRVGSDNKSHHIDAHRSAGDTGISSNMKLAIRCENCTARHCHEIENADLSQLSSEWC